MAMRRPRIKATANISSKRKPKPQLEAKSQEAKLESVHKSEVHSENVDSKSLHVEVEGHNKTDICVEDPCKDSAPAEDGGELANAEYDQADEDATTTLEDNSSFKCPPKVDYNRSISNSDDVFHSDIEDNVNVIQMDLQKSVSGCPMSPKTLARQRIRATPVFQRRNSFVGSVPSPAPLEEPTTPASPITSTPAPVEFAVPTQRRERHYSASLSQSSTTSHNYHTPHKFTPSMGGGRIRTESGCSAFSDSYALTSSKARKTEEHGQRGLSKREYEARFSSKVPDKSKLKMFDLIYYNPATNPMEQKLKSGSIKSEALPLEVGDVKPGVTSESGEATPSAMPVPQLKLNANGELILDDKSLEIETTAEQEARKALANSSLIFLDENTGMNGFYKRQKRTKDWPPDETVKFYRCLQTIGTDFSLMCQLFPKRTRRDLKLKFKKEERCNGTLINKALLYPKTFNVEELKDQLESEEREREEAERKWKEIKAKEAKNVKKTRVKTSSAARILKNGDDIYRNEMVYKRKMSKRALAAAESDCKPITNDIRIIEDIKIPCVGDPHEPPPLPKPKKRKRAPNTKKIKIEEVVYGNDESVQIKTELMPNAPNPVSLISASEDSNLQYISTLENSNEIQGEINELLTGDVPAYNSSNSFIKSDAEMQFTTFEYESHADLAPTTDVTLMNLDDGSVTIMQDSEMVVPTGMSEPPSESLTVNEIGTSLSPACDLDEHDIQQILTELSEGSLVLVSTLDPDNADKVLNEIYMLDKNTGELCDEPLAIPEAIVQAILSVMS